MIGMQPERRLVPKAVGYVVRAEQLLVFTQDDVPIETGGVQVPAGTIEPDEDSEDAVIREVREEPGIGTRVVRSLWWNVSTSGPRNWRCTSATSSNSPSWMNRCRRVGAPVSPDVGSKQVSTCMNPERRPKQR